MVVFHVLRCARCETFQVQQVTKSQKWKCKLCGEKQSTIKVFGEGTGAECRHHVQKLNTMRGQMDQEQEERNLRRTHLVNAGSVQDGDAHVEQPDSMLPKSFTDETKPGSRWSSYIDDEDEPVEGVFGTADRLPLPGNGEARLRGLVTTDWGEYRKRRRQINMDRVNTNRKASKLCHSVADKEKSSRVGMDPPSNLKTDFELRRQSPPELPQNNHNVLHVKRNHATQNISNTGHMRKPPSETPTSEGGMFISKPRSEDAFPIVHPSSSTQPGPLKEHNSTRSQQKRPLQATYAVSSKWAAFLDIDGEESEESEDECNDAYVDSL